MRKALKSFKNYPRIWNWQKAKYQAKGKPGIEYQLFNLFCNWSVGRCNVLLYRNEDGIVVGILKHYPDGLGPELHPGDAVVLVDPDHQREGIGTALLREGIRRWKIKLSPQEYTPEGLALAKSLEEAVQHE